jgi:hypothetical protein
VTERIRTDFPRRVREVEHTWIPLADRCRLAARMWLPEDADSDPERGTGESDGIILDEYSKQEEDDALEVMAWLADQPWCSGAVGMWGISWGGS